MSQNAKPVPAAAPPIPLEAQTPAPGKKRSKGATALVATLCTVALALTGIFGYGYLSTLAMRNRLGDIPAPDDVSSWVASGSTTGIKLKTSAEMAAYERELIDSGAAVISKGVNATVIQRGLDDIILYYDMNGSGEIIVLPGVAVDWPMDTITQALPRPINCTLVHVEAMDDVSASYTFRGSKESTARKYVEDLIVEEGWVITGESNYSGASGPFMVELARDADVLIVDFYGASSSYVVHILTS